MADDFLKQGRAVIAEEVAALQYVSSRLDKNFDKAARLVKACRGRVILTGLGKSGHVAAKIAATMSSLGVPAVFMHSAEALHGDSGMALKGDVVIAISNSGATREVSLAAGRCKSVGIPVIALTGNTRSGLAAAADVVIDISVAREADHLNLAPTSSTAVTMAVGDALAVAVSMAKGFKSEDFAFNHWSGALGKKAAAKKKKA